MWDLAGWTVVGGASDVDLITHLVEATASRGRAAVYPGDWYGFLVGGTHDDGVGFADAPADLACLCVPSVRNGHLTREMVAFLDRSPVQLLNLNLFPTLSAPERAAVATALAPLLPTALVSISFSRGFGLTASQLGALLVPPGHPWAERFGRQWDWSTYFHNALAARAFLHVDLDALAAVDDRRRAWVGDWRAGLGLPPRPTGSYYVHAVRPDAPVAPHLAPVTRATRLRLCPKPTPT